MEPNCVRRRKKREVLRHLSSEKKILKSKRESHGLKAVRDDNSETENRHVLYATLAL
jgi:hypothetical protein